MQQSESPAAASTVVRQLDFATNLNPMILPGHPQAQLELKLRVLAQSPPRMAAMPHWETVMRPKSPKKEMILVTKPLESAAAVAELSLPVEPGFLHYSALQRPLVSKKTTEIHQRSNPEHAYVTPNKKKKCSCKNSRCVKLYCECFASGIYCDECNCINCCNKIEFDECRRDAIRTTLERKPDAFKSKMASSPDHAVEHNRGCNCKKTSCLKKYCECYQANTLCSEKCKCVGCKNYEGSEENILHQAYSIAFQQPRTVAFNDAFGSPHKKINTLEFGFSDSIHRQGSIHLPHLDQNATFSMSDISYAPVSKRICKPAAQHPKHSYRSMLSGILQEEHIQNLCTTMINATAQPPKCLSDKKNGVDPGVVEVTACSSREDKEDENKNSIAISSNQSDPPVVPDRMPLSPETQALICDEQARTFMRLEAPSTTQESAKSATEIQPSESAYIEQERLVLTHFCNFLNTIITRGSIRESKMELDPE